MLIESNFTVVALEFFVSTHFVRRLALQSFILMLQLSRLLTSSTQAPVDYRCFGAVLVNLCRLLLLWVVFLCVC